MLAGLDAKPLRRPFRRLVTDSGALPTVIFKPETYFAKGDFDPVTNAGNDDAPAWNRMLDALRTRVANDGFGVSQFTRYAIECEPGAIYRIGSTLNFTGLRSRGIHIYMKGATFYCKDINNAPVIDALYSLGLNFHDGLIYAENGATSGTLVQPSYGLVFGRKDAGDASQNHFTNFRIVGWFNNACLMNISGELNSYSECNFENNVVASSDYTGLAVHLTDENEAGFTSAFQANGSRTLFGMNENLFNQCNFNSTQGVPIRVNGVTRSCKFHQCYAAGANAFPAVRVRGSHFKLELDIHCETSNLTSNVEFDVRTDNVNIYGFRLRDHAAQASDLMTKRAGAGAVNIYNGEIEVDGWDGIHAATAKIATTAMGVNFHGEMRLGASAESLHNLNGFNSYRGRISTTATAATLSNRPGAGYIWTFSALDAFPVLYSAGSLSGMVSGGWQVTQLNDSAGLKIVGSRNLGWTPGTGTANKGAFATGTATTSDCAQRLLAIEQALRAHGLID